MSINDTPAVRQVFGHFRMEAVQTSYSLPTASAGAGKRVGELIIPNGAVKATASGAI